MRPTPLSAPPPKPRKPQEPARKAEFGALLVELRLIAPDNYMRAKLLPMLTRMYRTNNIGPYDLDFIRNVVESIKR